MPFLGIHSIRTKIIAAIFAVVAFMALLGLHVLRVHVLALRSHDRQMSGIISEYRLSVATDQLIAVYSSCIQNPQNSDYRAFFAQKASEVEFLLAALANRPRTSDYESLFAGLENTARHVLSLCREGIAALDAREVGKTETIYQDLIRKQQFVVDNSARLIVREVEQASADQSRLKLETKRSLAALSIVLSAAVAACIFYALSVAKTLTLPLRALTGVARTIASGDMSADVPPHLLARPDEAGSLAASFNQMLDHLRAILDNLRLEVDVRQRAERRADQANAAKSLFLANMSHEIRTPLNAIIGFAELLSAEIPDPRQRQRAAIVSDSGKSLLRLLNDVLDLSKIESGKIDVVREPASVHRLLDEIKTSFSLRAQEKGLRLEVSIAPNVPDPLLLDGARLRQILVNLVGNALKFTDRGGVSVSVDCFDSGAPPPSCPMCVSLRIAVADSGIGIHDDFKPRIFEPFEQMPGQDSAKYGGTGLGLSISRTLARLMNGEISVADNPSGPGSVFCILLRDVPVVRRSALPPPQDVDFAARVSFPSPPSVLVVDDVKNNRELLSSYLAPLGFRVAEAENGVDALELLADSTPNLVLTDLKMPVMDGQEFLEKIHALFRDAGAPPPPVVAIAASPPPNAPDSAARFDGFILKPVSKSALLREIARFVPHSLSAPQPPPATPSPPPPAPSSPPDLASALDDDIRAEVAALRVNLLIPRARRLADRLCETGRSRSSPALVRLGDELNRAADSFHIDRLLAVLDRIAPK